MTEIPVPWQDCFHPESPHIPHLHSPHVPTQSFITVVFCQLVRQVQPIWAIAEDFCLLHQSFSDHIRVIQNDHRMEAEIQPEYITITPSDEQMNKELGHSHSNAFKMHLRIRLQ